jgi:hypothetical protein
MLAGIGYFVYSATRPQTAASSAPQNELPTPTATSAVGSPMPEVDGVVDSPPGFTVSVLDNGWSRYVSGAEGFSIELPPGWLTGTRDDLGPELKFSATDTEPTYGPVSGGGSPGVFVMKHPVHEGEVPRLYYEMNRFQLQEDPRVIGEVELTDTNLGSGRTYVIRAMYRSPFGRRSETMYGLLLGSFEFRLHFAVPAHHLNEYEGLFHDIASTFHASTP